LNEYSCLSRSGKLRRLHELAVTALARYDLDQLEIAYHGFDTNLLYRVTAGSGERFMLRLASPGWRTFEDLNSEALWLAVLSRDTSLPVPRIIAARSGEYVLPLSGNGVPKVWNASLMSWVPGRLLGHYLTRQNLTRMGGLFAELHHHGATWQPPAGFTTRRFEHWLSRGEENLIIEGDKNHPNSPVYGSLAALPAHWRQGLERMHRQVEAAYAAIDRSDLRVIHCDLWHDNIKLHRGALHPFDFEDTVWGFRAHDIAMAMLDLLESTDEERYADLLAAFRRGYEAQMAWPDDPIEPFQVGRLLWKINWVARFQPEQLASMVERHVPVFNNYEKTGQIVRA
jgi:Ser/Thr protein kinase RdoA (MazF antagonist)